jgi:nitric oxide dioxygenase
MYERMFTHDPEVKPYFNPANQISGRQQKALSAAVCAYALHIENPAALSDAVELIAQKHTSLGILPEHYPIVGRNLLAAIRQVLGAAATDAVMAAWEAAYAQLADTFIERERQIYAGQKDYHGWNGLKRFVVTERIPVSDNIMSVYLKPDDGQPLPPHEPGQYIAIHANMPDGGTALRNYSLSNAPGSPYYRITVKREDAPRSNVPGGKFSSHVHTSLRAGDAVQLSPPCGEFTLKTSKDATRPLVFLAGGVGITPLMSMLHTALADEANRRRPVVFIQAARCTRLRPFADELSVLDKTNDNLRLHVRYNEPEAGDLDAVDTAVSAGLIDSALLDRLVGGGAADYYFCGPEPMLVALYKLLKSRAVPDTALHYEFFGPAGKLDTGAA